MGIRYQKSVGLATGPLELASLPSFQASSSKRRKPMPGEFLITTQQADLRQTNVRETLQMNVQ